MGTKLPQKKRHGQHPIFGPCLLWQNGWMDHDATWYGGKPRPWRRCVGWGRSYPTSLKGHSPQLLVHAYCGQTAGWMKTPLCTVVEHSPGHIVLDGDPASPPPRKGHSSPLSFGSCLLWPRSPILATAELLYNIKRSLCHVKGRGYNKNCILYPRPLT